MAHTLNLALLLGHPICVYVFFVFVCMYACVYVCMYNVCVYVCIMYVCTDVCECNCVTHNTYNSVAQ